MSEGAISWEQATGAATATPAATSSGAISWEQAIGGKQAAAPETPSAPHESPFKTVQSAIGKEALGLSKLAMSGAEWALQAPIKAGANVVGALASPWTGETSKEVLQSSQRIAEKVEPVSQVIENTLKAFPRLAPGQVEGALQTVSRGISSAANSVETSTKGVVPSEAFEETVNALMMKGPEAAAKGIKTLSSLVKAKQIDLPTAEKVEATKVTDPPAADAHAWLAKVDLPEKPLYPGLKKAGFVGADGKPLSFKDAQGGKVDPELLLKTGLAAAGIAGYTALSSEQKDKALAAGALMLGLGMEGRVDSALGPALKKYGYTTRVLDRLPQNRTEFSRAQLEQTLKQQDIPAAEKTIFNDFLAKNPGDKFQAKDVVNHFKLATGDFKLQAKETGKYADYGLERIRKQDAKGFIPAESNAATTLYRLPEHMEVSAANHFGDNRLFGWTRSFKEDGVRHVVEVQSDLAQHAKGAVSEGERPALIQEVAKLSAEAEALKARRFGPGENKAWEESANHFREIERRLSELRVKLQATAVDSQLGPILKSWPKRLIQEEMARAAQSGESKVRFASADTVAKVEGWPRNITLQEGAEGVFSERAGQRIRGSFRGTLTDFVSNGKISVSDGNLILHGNEVDVKGRPLRETTHRLEKESAPKSLVESEKLSPEHYSIYNRYAGDITRYLKSLDGKEVTDAKGHTWIEVPTVRGPVKMFGKADPKLLAMMAAVGAGAAVSVAYDPKHPLGMAALGAAAGFGLTRIGGPLWDSIRKPTERPTSAVLADDLHKLTTQSQANQIGMLKFAQTVPRDYAQHAESIYHSLEDPRVPLTPRAAELKKQFVEPLLTQNAALRDALKKEGIEVGTDVDAYVHRIAKGKPSIFEEFEASSPQGRTVSQFSPALQERKVFSMQDPATGEKLYGVMNPKGNGYKVYSNGEIVGSSKTSAAELNAGKISFGERQWERGQATTREIEAHTPIRYYHDALASSIGSNTKLTQVYNNVKFLKDLTQSPEFEKIATKGAAPHDWREVTGIPTLRGFKLEPRVANVIDDFTGGKEGDLAANIGKVSRVLTGSLFWNPLSHIYNVLDHAVIQRGLVSGWLNPAAYPRLARTTLQAVKAVTNLTPEYARFIKEGAGLMYPSVLVHDFSAKVLKAIGTDEKMTPVAKAFGYANPAEMVKRIYAFSRANLWAANDIIMMQAYLEKEAIKKANVIEYVERHIPNYRVPDKVVGSRMLSQAMRSPVVLAFGRYDYGRMRSYGAMLKDAIGKDTSIADRAKALDQLAMVAVMGLVVYPLVMDRAAKALTGNSNATMQRFGASTIPYLVYEYLHQDKSLSQVIGSAFPQGMAVKAAEELVNNRDLFTGKHLIEQPSDVARYAAKQLAPLGTAARVEEGKMSLGQMALSAVGIKSPTPTQVARQAQAKMREETYTRRRLAE